VISSSQIPDRICEHSFPTFASLSDRYLHTTQLLVNAAASECYISGQTLNKMLPSIVDFPTPDCPKTTRVLSRELVKIAVSL